MNKRSVVLAAMAICLLGATAAAQTIECRGTACNGPGTALTCTDPKDYMYLVTFGGLLDTEDSVLIGVHDANLANYSSFCMPTGWTVDIILGPKDDNNKFTEHGNVSAIHGECPYVLLFRNMTHVQIPPFTQIALGFNHAEPPHDVDWKLAGSSAYIANWSAVVGLGAGPVHSPFDPCLTDSIWIGTGYNPLYEIVEPIGRANAYWQMWCDPDPLTDMPLPTISITKNQSWKDALLGSNWVSSKSTDIYEVAGVFCFDYYFCLEGQFSSIMLDISLRADDTATVWLNTNLLGATPNPSHNSINPTRFVVTNPALFNTLTGVNQLHVEVDNVGFPGMGFNLAGFVRTDSYALKKPWCCDSTGMIVGVKWHDLNGDGWKDPTEPVLPGWTVYLINDGNVYFDVTDGLGQYSFGNVVPGGCDLFESVITSPLWCQTYPPIPGHHGFSLTTKGAANRVNFGNRLAGDINGDGAVDVGDVVYLINYLFKGGPDPVPLSAADVNCDGSINVGDGVHLINYIFKSGPPPCCP